MYVLVVIAHAGMALVNLIDPGFNFDFEFH